MIKLALRNCLRNKKRTIVTGLSVILAVFVVLLIMSFMYSCFDQLAENARKYIKKKKMKELNALGGEFIKGAIANGCPEKEAEIIWDKMNAFSAYSFSKVLLFSS